MQTPFTTIEVLTPEDLVAFQTEYSEYLDLINSTLPEPEPQGIERDLCDMVREHEESEENTPISDPAGPLFAHV